MKATAHRSRTRCRTCWWSESEQNRGGRKASTKVGLTSTAATAPRWHTTLGRKAPRRAAAGPRHRIRDAHAARDGHFDQSRQLQQGGHPKQAQAVAAQGDDQRHYDEAMSLQRKEATSEHADRMRDAVARAQVHVTASAGTEASTSSRPESTRATRPLRTWWASTSCRKIP